MRKIPLDTYILSTFALAVAFSCRTADDSASSETRPTTLRVAAASDLQPWLGVALESWGKAQKPSIRVETVYGSSHQLATQIRSGAPVDLFLSADYEAVMKLASVGIVEKNSVRPYAQGGLALLARKNLSIQGLDDLKTVDFRHLAIASPETAPYGKAAKSALLARGLWDVLKPKLVVTGSVRQAYQHVLDGNAEAGILFIGHARSAASENPELIAIEIPQDFFPPIIQYLGIVKSDQNVDNFEINRKDESKRSLAEWISGSESIDFFRSNSLNRPSKSIMEQAKKSWTDR